MSTVQDPAEKPERQAHSPWSFRIATIAGIPIRIHFTFVLFLTWIALASQGQGGLIWPLFVIVVFFCVLLHELGHALTAQRYAVQTRDITLYPIGGLAMLDGRPTARQELWIALAGPMINFVIAGILYVVLSIKNGAPIPISFNPSQNAFMEMVLAANLTLGLFNLVPAFPMDGGRVLRAALALRMPEVQATRIAAAVGQGLAILLGFFGLFTGQIVLMLIAFFVYLGAGQELSTSITRSFLTGHKVADAMQVRFRTLDSGATMDAAAQALLAGSQHDFPVVAGEEVVGLLTRTDIARGLATDDADAYVAGHMDRDFQTAHPNLPLERVMEMFNQKEPEPILVIEDGRLLGMLTQENLSEFIMLEHARSSRGRPYGYQA